jgi:DNA-binding NtrC family response regulator
MNTILIEGKMRNMENFDICKKGVIYRNMEILNNTDNFNINKNNNITKTNFEAAREILIKIYIYMNINGHSTPMKKFINTFEKCLIDVALLVAKGNQKQAALILGVKQTALCEKIKKYRIKKHKEKKMELDINALKIETLEEKKPSFLNISDI